MQNLYRAFSQIKTEKEFNAFLDDLCTPKEIKNMSERWKLAQLLYTTNLTQPAIVEKVGATRATITRVARVLYNLPVGGYRLILARLYPARTKTLSENQMGKLTTLSRRHHP